MKLWTGRRLGLLGLVVGVGVVAGGIAYASIPDSNGVIHGCYGKSDGTLRVIDTGTGGTCNTKKELAVNWNQTGPTGLTGPSGSTGPTGPAGTARAWAVVGPAGVITNGLNVTSVDHLQTGEYCVFLNGIDASQVAAVVTSEGYLTAASSASGGCGSPQGGIHVVTWYTTDGTLVDSGFNVAVP